MPGVNSVSFGFSREVGKMALMDHTLDLGIDLQTDILDFVSPSTSSSSSPSHDFMDSDVELPDNENPVALLDFLDNYDNEPPGLSSQTTSDGLCKTRGVLLKSCRADPFMGPAIDTTKNGRVTDFSPDRISHCEDHLPNYNDQQMTENFSAWGHKPTSDEDEHMMFVNSLHTPYDDDDTDDSLPDTPSSYSSTLTGDDSDVDIETVTDLPRNADVCGYSTQDSSSPGASPPRPTSPLRNMVSILQSSCLSPKNLSTNTKSIRFNSCGVSNSVSLAENLMNGRSGLSGQKRKLHKERKHISKSNSSSVSSVSFSSNGNCVNFHDYAMSPVSSMSTDTAQPTVLPKKSMYKRRQMSSLDQEKQHHHNQLERNRRQKLADLFIDLRDEVPSIANQAKASKVMILNQATSYIADLNRLEQSQQSQISSELRKRESLRKQCKQLTASCS